MNTIEIEAYQYYKEFDAPFIIFFRIENEYTTFSSDAVLVSNALDVPFIGEHVTFPAGMILDVLEKLSKHGLKGKTVVYRDDSGRYVVPDVERLRSENELDK